MLLAEKRHIARREKAYRYGHGKKSQLERLRGCVRDEGFRRGFLFPQQNSLSLQKFTTMDTSKFDFLKDEGVEVVYLPRTPEISTTQIKEDLGANN